MFITLSLWEEITWRCVNTCSGFAADSSLLQQMSVCGKERRYLKKTCCSVCIVHITYGTHKDDYMYMRLLADAVCPQIFLYLFHSEGEGSSGNLPLFWILYQTWDKLELNWSFGFFCHVSIFVFPPVWTFVCPRCWRTVATVPADQSDKPQKLTARFHFVSGLLMFWWLRTTVSCL